MTYFFAAVSAIVTAGLFAVAARVLGVEQNGILVAIGVIGAGLQLMFLVLWYLFHTRTGNPADA